MLVGEDMLLGLRLEHGDGKLEAITHSGESPQVTS